jgi:hypothetical protein
MTPELLFSEKHSIPEGMCRLSVCLYHSHHTSYSRSLEKTLKVSTATMSAEAEKETLEILVFGTVNS